MAGRLREVYPLYKRIPRKFKKKIIKLHGRVILERANFIWEYHNDIVMVRNARVIINYPEVATDQELCDWYKKHYPNAKERQTLCFSIKTRMN